MIRRTFKDVLLYQYYLPDKEEWFFLLFMTAAQFLALFIYILVCLLITS